MGYTRVDNWLFDVVMPTVDGSTFKIVCAVYRKTIGWNKESDVISVTHFQSLCGFSGRSITQRAIESAVNSGYVVRKAKGKSFEYTIPDSGTVDENNRTRIRYSIVPESGTSIVPESGNTKEKEKHLKGEPAVYLNGDVLQALVEHFTKTAGILPSQSMYGEKWEEPLKLILDNAGDLETAKQRITNAVDFARNGEKKYTVSSPLSLTTIIANMPDGEKSGTIEVRSR